jgi:hypothetical protein
VREKRDKRGKSSLAFLNAARAIRFAVYIDPIFGKKWTPGEKLFLQVNQLYHHTSLVNMGK